LASAAAERRASGVGNMRKTQIKLTENWLFDGLFF
jgi:hypothetical protein